MFRSMYYSLAERVGFEPTVPSGITGFQDRLLKPLGHLSIGLHQTALLLYYKKQILSRENSKFFWTISKSSVFNGKRKKSGKKLMLVLKKQKKISVFDVEKKGACIPGTDAL